MPTELARFYDVMDELGNYEYAFMDGKELCETLNMYYEMAKAEFPELFQ